MMAMSMQTVREMEDGQLSSSSSAGGSSSGGGSTTTGGGPVGMDGSSSSPRNSTATDSYTPSPSAGQMSGKGTQQTMVSSGRGEMLPPASVHQTS